MRSLSRVRLFATPWTVAYRAFPSMGFSRQEYWSRMPSPSLPSFLSTVLSLPLTASQVLLCPLASSRVQSIATATGDQRGEGEKSQGALLPCGGPVLPLRMQLLPQTAPPHPRHDPSYVGSQLLRELAHPLLVSLQLAPSANCLSGCTRTQ